MSYVEVCQKHGQHHTEICGECFEDLKEENTRLREVLKFYADTTEKFDRFDWLYEMLIYIDGSDVEAVSEVYLGKPYTAFFYGKRARAALERKEYNG